LKNKKLSKAEFLLQLPAVLEHEALQLWRKKRDEILTEPEDGEQRKVRDPLADVIKLFKEHFGVPSAEKVRELQTLRKGERETCRMLKSRVERLAEETGLLNGREQAMAFVKALLAELRQRVEPVLWAQSPSGVYSLDAAFQVAERIELAQAYAAGMQGWTESGGSSGRRVSAMQAVDETEGPCYNCGARSGDNKAAACRQDVGRCTACNKKGHKEAICWRAHPELKPDWMTGSSGGVSQSLSQKVDKLAEQLEQLARQVAVLAGKPVRSASARQATLEGHDGREYDEAPDEGCHPVSNGLGAQLFASPMEKHPMDADFEDPEYQARCAKIDAYFAEKEREWRSRNGQ
jgi:hypothetical protein